MKRLFNKRNPVSKVVALWLVFIMMAVPFFSNSGLLSNPKAATPVPTMDIVESMIASDFTVTDDGKVKLNPYSSLASIYYYGVDTVKVNASDVIFKDGPSSGANTVSQLEITDSNSETYTITDADIKIATSTSDNFAAELESTSTELKDTADVAVTDYYAIYIKVTANKAGTDCSYDKYVKMGSYNFESKEPFEDMTASLIDADVAGNPVSDTEWYTNTYINVSASTFIANMHKAVGNFKYGYAIGDGTITWKDVSSSFDVSNYEEVDFGDNAEGEYKVYLGYFAGDTLIESKEIDTVNIDTNAPSINSATGLYYNPNGWNDAGQNYTDQNVEKVDDNKVVRNESDKSKYRYFVVVDDDGRGVLASNVKIYDNGSQQSFTFNVVTGKTNVFYADSVVLSSGSTVAYQAQVSDAASLTSGLSAQLPHLELADTDKRDIELTWGKDSSSLETLPDSGTSSVVSDTRYKLHFKVTSYEKFNKIEVVDGNNTPRAQHQYNSHPTADPYYVYEYEIDVPLSESNAEYTDLKINLYFNGDTTTPAVTKTLTSSFIFDNTDPVFKDADDNNTTYAIPDKWNPTADEIKIDILSGETWSSPESDIVTTYYKIGNDTYDFAITNGKVGDGIIDISKITESSDATGTSIYIYAEDAAGNSNSVTVYYKKDTTAPVFDATTPLYFSKDNGTTKLSSDVVVNKDYTVYSNVSDNIDIKSVTYTLFDSSNNNLSSVVVESATEGCPLSTLIPQNAADGTYTIKAVATDITELESNKSEEQITFTLDTTDPVCADTVLQEYDTASTTWSDVVVDDGKTVYYLDGSKQYRYKVVVTDETAIDDTAVVVKTVTPGTLDNTVEGNTTTEKIFYINIDTSKLATYYSKDVEFTITDKAGNTKSDCKADWALQLINTDLALSATLYEITDEGDVKVELTDAIKEQLANGTNKAYYVIVEASSAYSIVEASVKLSYDLNGIQTQIDGVDYNTEMSNDPAVKDEYGRYHYYKKFTLANTSNISYKDLKVEAEDISGLPNGERAETLLSILFDKTSPIIYAGGSTTEVFTLPTEWKQSVSANIDVIPGNDTVVESKIAKAIYSIAGDSNEYTIPISGDGMSATGTVATPADFSSATAAGTVITVHVKDAAGNPATQTYTVKVDGKKPTIDSVSVAGNSNITVSDAPLNAAPTIKAKVTDNLTIDYINMYITYPDGTIKTVPFDYTEGVNAEVNGGSKEVSYTIPKLVATDANIPDGTYKVEVVAFDLAGNEATKVTKSFRVDNTNPVVTAKISAGTVSTKNAYYYKSNVTVTLTYKDANPDMSSIVVYDNGAPVDVTWPTLPDANGNYTATYTASAEVDHIIKITAKDAAKNDAIPAQEIFKIDKTVPTISTMLNGGINYTDNTGMLYMTNNVNLNAQVNDANEDVKDLNYQLILTKPDQDTVTNLYEKTSNRNFSYTEEGEYTINLFAVDLANNQSSVRSVKFRIDKAAPNLSINGVGAGSSADSVTVSCVMQESFWQDAEGTITIYRQAGDGVQETLLDTIEVTPSSASTVISQTFTETGTYRIEFTASDRAGHTSETSANFTIDREAPVVTLEGPENYAKTEEAVPITITISDDFYLKKEITLTGTRTDETGKVHDLDFGTWSATANPTNIASTFEEDGIYDISVTATDVAGNSDSASVHFTIDKTAPVIGDLSYLDDKILTSFSWEEDLDELVSDLTVCDVQMYLNGSEYDGESAIEDGSYTLLITAEDELGNITEKEVKFVLDTKVPVFIVTGVEEDEVKNEEYAISVSLQLDEDTLTSVTLNGKEMTIDGNTCTFNVTEKGDYKLTMTATDAAGNTASYELEFKYGEDSMWWIWLLIALAILLVSTIIIIIVKKKKEDK